MERGLLDARQAEHPLAHDVSLDVGCSAADRVGERLQIRAGPTVVAVHRCEAQALRAEDVHTQLEHPLVKFTVEQANDRTFRPGYTGADGLGDSGDGHGPQRRDLGTACRQAQRNLIVIDRELAGGQKGVLGDID